MAKREFVTYYETGSLRRGTLKFHKTTHSSKQAAIKKACGLSLKTGGHVVVMRAGLEVAACHRGQREF